MKKNLTQKIWSHGTPLGSLGPLSQGDVIVGPYGLQILVIWGPYEPPVLVACQAQAENPKSAGALCDIAMMVLQTRKGTLRVLDPQKRWVPPPSFCKDLGGGYTPLLGKNYSPPKNLLISAKIEKWAIFGIAAHL